ncbi:kinesin-like protein KIN-5A [Hordeum vulgare subsp. vulgare]|uniref:Kinesin motor domain-containing protein n=1 Tax=Hordeum vulgare subsp. vulgare TaxID=112509 RepID=A0A8I7B0G3_HORVV|nr:kinesin-like protein KIN-5A [Hordeum vulgare subsp. vulgare]
MEKRGGTPSPSPRSTEKSGKDLTRSGDANGGASTGGNATPKGDKEKGVNVQVILRCRPLSDDETKGNTPVVISCNERRREVAATQVIANKQIDRTFAFDKVFGPSSKQKDLFEQSISPIVHEVLEGYNCTIFAYGQTGTGKTYTMEGGGTRKAKSGELPTDAGVIPRSVRQIFDILEAQCAEYSMKVTFLELYNEEITDLLAPDEPRFPVLPVPEDKNKKPIALMEDGKGGVFVRGLEEEVVYSAGEIYKILDKGSAKRRTAETLLNKQSSRSHSIFSITIHIKELTHESEEMIKIGKLNLVDLAGSENISRSGARDGRAREAGEINKSLLTLGRVINALVEHSGHVPYRDSKLTRLLRDSLGGKTKTCIIATISPSVYCLEETLSTLDYAHRAKNIRNKPEVNQKMMKSAVIKDLYSEIDRLKQEVFAAREKNGIYIPRERYLQEEAEKKAMTEKIEKLGADLEARDKQLVELKELYDAQMLLSAELGGKLEKTQKDLEDTRNALHDLEEKYSEAKSTIKEKEFVIFNLQNSEKSLVDCAYNLRAELENAAADVSGLFSKIERKDKIEDGNRSLVQRFRSQLTQELDALHKTVSTSVMQQEDHLKEMEDDMQSFVSSKDEAAQGLKESIQNLKALHGSGITALDNLAGEIDLNSQTTFEKLNSQVQSHTSDLEKCFGVIALGADNLLNELQCSLSKQEERLAHFANKQREGHLRAVEASRSISNITVGFFHSLDVHASELTSILEETQGVQDQQLIDLEKKFEECAANEEKQLIEKVAEMLAISNARKKKLVQTAVGGLRESAVNRTGQLQKEISTAQDFTSSVREKWGFYMEETENNYIEDTTAVDSGRSCLAEVLVECKTKTGMGAQQWKSAEDSLFSLGKGNVESVDSIVRTGREANQLLRSKLSSAVSTTLEDIDVANKAILSSIDSSLKVDHEACANIVSVLTPCHGEMTELKGAHYHKVVEITGNAGKCLEEEYLVDEPSCSTPRRREIDLPSAESIEELRTPGYDELLRSFHELRAGRKQANGDTKHLPEAQEESPSSVRDGRVPLIARN